MQDGRPTGGLSTAGKLSDADAGRIRERRAAGASRQDLAREYSVSVATITRITRGETYRPRPEPDQVVIVELSEPEPPDPARWTEPKRPGREWRDD